ncbi:MAG: phosphatase PAP2 family protein [Protaetiibacter sp.]
MTVVGRATADPDGAVAAAPRRPRGMLLAGVAGLVVFAAFAFSVAVDVEHPWIQPLDDAWRALVGTGPDAPTWWLPMFFQYLGEGAGNLFLIILVPVALLCVRRWRSALFFFTASLSVSLVVSQLTKNLVHRPRPAEDLENGLYGPLFSVDHGSLPSGHAVTTGIVIVAVAALLPPAWRRIWWVVAALLGAGMVWQRTLINAHWLSDTLVGLLGGIAGTLILWWAFYPLLARDRGRPLRRRARVHAAPIEGETA